MDITYRPLKISESPQACELMNSAYARQKIPDYFEWLYFQSPTPALLFGAFYKKKLVGMAGMVERSLESKVKVGAIMDILVAEKFRGQGIFSQLIKELQQANPLDAYCSFTNYYGMSALTKGLGWQKVLRIDALNIKLNGDADFNKKVLKCPDNTTIINRFEVDPKYLNWRFQQSPLYTYEVLKKPVGTVVCKVFTDPLTKQSFGDIVYLQAKKTTAEALKELVTTALDHFQELHIQQVTTWALPQTQLFCVLQALGFTTQAQERYICLDVHNTKYQSLANGLTWEVFQGDSEVF